MNYNLILASKSSRRKDILKMVGMPYKSITPKISEKEYLSDTSKDAKSIALTIAKEKAKLIAEENLDSIVLSADTIVVLDNEVIGKPKDIEDAKVILNRLSGNKHSVITAYNIVWKSNNIDILDYEETFVQLYPISYWEIEYYLKTEDTLDAAGAYKIQGSFAKFIKEINGSYHNVMGLPIGKIYNTIKELLEI